MSEHFGFGLCVFVSDCGSDESDKVCRLGVRGGVGIVVDVNHRINTEVLYGRYSKRVVKSPTQVR